MNTWSANQPLELNQGTTHYDTSLSKDEAMQCHDIKAAKKQMKRVLLVMVTVNIVILLLLTVLAIVGGIQIQSKFHQVMSRQNLSTSQINELTTKTNANTYLSYFNAT